MKYVIVGGVAGGASSAARLRRLDEKAEIIMFEKRTSCIFFQLLFALSFKVKKIWKKQNHSC